MQKIPIFLLFGLFLTPSFTYCLMFSTETMSEEYFYASYLGGSGYDVIRDMVLNSAGEMILVGTTFSTDFPIQDAYQPTYAGGVRPEEPPIYGGDGFITMISNTGEIVWSTFHGGSMLDFCERVVTVGDEIIIAGVTNSQDLTIIDGDDQVSYNGGQSDVFVAVYSIVGELLRSVYLGGSGAELIEDIVINHEGELLLVGFTESNDLPVTMDAYQDNIRGEADGFLVKMDPSNLDVLYLSYFGGSGRDGIGNIALNPTGGFYISGYTDSGDFPLTDNAFQSSIVGSERDTFLTLFSDELQLEYSTYLGGSAMEDCFDLAVDSLGSAILSGRTWSDDFPTINAFQPQYSNIEVDGFYTKFSPDGESLEFSSYLGYSGWDTLNRLCITEDDDIVLAGMADTSDFPVVNGFQESKHEGTDIYILMLDSDGNHIFASYLGGNGMELPWGCINQGSKLYLVAQTTSSNMITSSDALMNIYAGDTDGYFFTLDLEEYLDALEQNEESDEGSSNISSYWASYYIVTILSVCIFAGWYIYNRNRN